MNFTRLTRMEGRARTLQRKMDELQTQWAEEMARVKWEYPAEWRQHCKETGICEHYNFGDVLC